MDLTPDSASPATAREYMLEHRGKMMVLQKAEGQIPGAGDFFLVESVGSHPSGLVITGVFEHNRRQRLRPSEMRPATEWEIASHKA